MMESLPPTKQKELKLLFPTAPAEAIDFMQQCLRFNPAKRLTAKEALSHPFVAQFHNPDTEPACPHVLRIAVDDNTK